MTKQTVQGVSVFFGARSTPEVNDLQEVDSVGGTVELTVDIDVTDPNTYDNQPILIASAGEALLRADIEVLTAVDSSGNDATITLGLEGSTGTDIDADGIDATVAESALDTAGKLVSCDGAMVDDATGKGGEVTVAAYLLVTTANTPTAGKLRLRVVKRKNPA